MGGRVAQELYYGRGGDIEREIEVYMKGYKTRMGKGISGRGIGEVLYNGIEMFIGDWY